MELQLLKYRVLAECYDDNDKLDKYVRFMPGNYDMQFDKSFIEPLKNIITLIGWNVEPVASLDSFFG
mgnify:CR=1 FL=1